MQCQRAGLSGAVTVLALVDKRETTSEKKVSSRRALQAFEPVFKLFHDPIYPKISRFPTSTVTASNCADPCGHMSAFLTAGTIWLISASMIRGEIRLGQYTGQRRFSETACAGRVDCSLRRDRLTAAQSFVDSQG